jgi:hypothetical protein
MRMEEQNVVEMMERLDGVVSALEAAAERMAERQVALAAEVEGHVERCVGRITATVESAREAELEKRLAEAEARIAELSASAASSVVGRKTLPAGMSVMLAKQGVSLQGGEGEVVLEAASLDAALASLSVEQRIAVKAELLRTGMLR